MVKNIINSGLTNEMLEMTYPDKYYKDVIEPAKTGKGPVPSKMQMMMKSQPFKAVTMPFREMMSPGKFGAFRSSGTPLASKALGLGRTALGGPFGIGSLIGTGIGYGADAIARATNTPEEYEAMKEKARSDYMGTGYFDDVDISQDAPTVADQTISEVNIPDTISGNFGSPGSVFTDGPGTYEVNPDGQTASLIGRPNMSDIAGLGDLGNPTGDSRVVSEEMGMTGTPTFGRPSMADIAGQINENLIDRGNPLGDSRIASEEQGLSGFPGLGQVDRGFQDVLDAREARRNQIEMQQNPDYGQFFDVAPLNEEKKGLASFFNNPISSLAMRLSPIGFLQDLGKLNSARNAYNSFRSGSLGNAVNTARTGIGSLGSRFAGKMRGINPYTGRPNTQSQYEANRSARQTQNRIDNMLERKAKGLSYSQKNLDRLSAEVNKGINEREAAALADKTKSTNTGVRTDIDVADGGAESGGRSKIVCTMMNERYGFGSFRNKIWMKFHEHHGPEYQKGYHAIFLPLVKIAKGEGKINTAVRKVLEHMGRHVTADMFKIMKGKKRDTLGRIYRAIFEPACHIIGKIKSALGRG